MTPDSAQAFGVALTALWSAVGAVAIGRAAAKSPAARALAAAFRKSNLAAKCALVAGLAGAVAIGGTKPEGRDAPTARPQIGRFVETSLPAPHFALVEVRTNGVSFVAPSANAVVSESVRRRGTSEDGEWIETDAPFFRWGTNPVSRVYASPAVISFGTMRHPTLGAALPDGTPAESLVALRTPLGIAPEANWPSLAAPSRFWHERTPGGMVFTWENALLDRLSDRPATIQIETWDGGDFAFRYDFSAASPTNDFFVGAQLGPAAVEALGVRGGVTNSATVYRVDDEPVPAGASLADLFASPVLELRWKNVAGLGDLSVDTDGDGLTDWDEIFLHATDPAIPDTDGDGLSDAAEVLAGADPLDADEDGDGVPDGVDPVVCAADPLWAANASNSTTSVTITLNAAIPAGASASLVVGDLCIPLRSPGSWTLALVPGELYAYRLHTSGAAAELSIAPASNSHPQRSVQSLRSVPAPFPLWIKDPDGVFDGPSNGGEGEMAVPTLELEWVDPGDGSHVSAEGICLHDTTEARFSWKLRPFVLAGRIGELVLDNLCRDHQDMLLAVSETAAIAEGIASLPAGSLRFGHLAAVARAHLCDADYRSPACSVCGLHQFLYEAWHDVDYLTVVPMGLANDREIVQFPGGTTRTFNPAASPVPDLHQPYFYEDARANVLPESFYDHANATGYMTPGDDPPESVFFSWRCVEGSAGPLPENGTGTWASFLVPMQGGVYRFRFQCGSLPPGDAVLVLPLAGASVDDVVSAAIVQADAFSTSVVQKYSWRQRNSPANGIKWFWSNGAGDFLGRPDNGSSRTVRYYNQVNDSGMGAVCTWNGRCVRLAKLSNFICGYACEKTGVSQVLQDISQGSGTSNDSSATASWLAGEFYAEGLMTLDQCSEVMSETSWESGDEKVRRLWPNNAPADNFAVPDMFFDPDTQFTAPGFLYMEDP